MKLGYPHSKRRKPGGEDGSARLPVLRAPDKIKLSRKAFPKSNKEGYHDVQQGCGCNDIFLILILLCCCGKNDCGCYDRKGCDCCDMLVWLLLINCICGKNDCGCCK